MGTPGFWRGLRPARLGRHGRQNGGDVAAGLQAENRAPVIKQIELDVTAPADQLLLPLGRAPWGERVSPHDLGIDGDEALTDVAHEREVVVKSGIGGVAGAVQPIEENAAYPARLVAVLEEEIFVAPGFVAFGVGDLGMALAGRAHRRMKRD